MIVRINIEIDYKGLPPDSVDVDLNNSLKMCEGDINNILRCIMYYMQKTSRVLGESIDFTFNIKGEQE